MKRVFFAVLLLIYIPCLIRAQEYKIKPGIVITKENYKNYLPELKKLLPLATFPVHLNGLKNGWITIPIVDMKYPVFNPEYLEAGKKNVGKLKVGPKNKIIGDWISGPPFPNPKTGAELAWDMYRRGQYLDDISMKSPFLLFDKNAKEERRLFWYLRKKLWTGRLIFPPMPEFSGNNQVFNSKESIVILNPYDIRGFCMLRIRYEDIEKPDEVYSYIPAIRRIRRLTGSDVTDPMLGSDCIYDDFEMCRQKIDVRMTFKIKDGQVLFPVRNFEKKPKNHIVRNCFQLDWEIRDVWILQLDGNDPRYVYSRRIIYVDKDGSFTLPYSENYDQKGRLFRTSQHIQRLVPHKGKFYHDVGYGYLYRDYITGHSTVMDIDPIFHDPKNTADSFTIRNILKEVR
ncbi:MAG: DUF1329 domain-containing protein [Thermodesulfobacteriota bacterium]|nr:DUF1329 domain-containing protein [Thermodesulfobacteriota bacterium]